MKIKRSTSKTTSTEIRFVLENESGAIPDFKGKADELTIRYEGNDAILYCGLGNAATCNFSIMRSAAAQAAQMILKLQRKKVSIRFSHLSIATGTVIAGTLLEGFLLGLYRFSKYKSENQITLQTIELVECTLTTKDIRKIQTVTESVFYARDLVNDNASVVTPAYLVKQAQQLSHPGVLSVTVIKDRLLKQKNLNLITTVGQGAPVPPALIILEYRGNKKSTQTTAIVGKGVTFDSGGQNLKPTGSIETMRHDMAGAAAVLGIMKACAVQLPLINVTGIIPAVHNAIGSNAFYPGDVYTSYSGKTVEVWSTDAEGRLILADAVAYCRDQYTPTEIIDLATLTGGVKSALGTLVAGLFSNDDTIAERLFYAGEQTGERLWRFPLYEEYCDSIKGDIGDLRNLSKFKKGYASSIIGAAFIKEFIGDTPWGHIDIAGTAFNEGSSSGITPQYATGFGVRLLLSYLGIS